LLEETSETLFEGARIRHGALGRQGECVRHSFLPGCRLAAARVRAFGAI
jgi:hypothetical protein